MTGLSCRRVILVVGALTAACKPSTRQQSGPPSIQEAPPVDSSRAQLPDSHTAATSRGARRGMDSMITPRFIIDEKTGKIDTIRPPKRDTTKKH